MKGIRPKYIRAEFERDIGNKELTADPTGFPLDEEVEVSYH